MFGYNYFHQFSNGTFLSVSSELDTGFALFFVFFGDMVEILLFIIFIMMCPGVPDPRCGSGARAYFLSGMALVAKVEAKNLFTGK